MSNLATRILTALIAGGAVIGGIIAHELGTFLFCALISVLGWMELIKIAGNDSKVVKYAGLVIGLGVWGILFFYPAMQAIYLWSLLIPIAGIFMLWEKKIKFPIHNVGVGSLGVFYVFLPFMLLYFLSIDYHGWNMSLTPFMHSLAGGLFPTDFYVGDIGPYEGATVIGGAVPSYDFRIPLGILLLTWTTDSMAYFGGKFLGKNKLFERISPKKTWEGTIIGALFCIGLGVLFECVWPVRFSWIVVAIIIAIFTQLGDLVESMFKRSLKIKDSGGLLPGHGGVLDRFDGPFITLPLIGLYDFLIHIG